MKLSMYIYYLDNDSYYLQPVLWHIHVLTAIQQHTNSPVMAPNDRPANIVPPYPVGPQLYPDGLTLVQ